MAAPIVCIQVAGRFLAAQQRSTPPPGRRPQRPIRHSVARLTDLVPLVVERKILVDDSLADRLNAVEPCVTLVTRLEERRNVGRHRELQALRCVQSAVVLHEDDRAVISLKRRPDVNRSRALRTGSLC